MVVPEQIRKQSEAVRELYKQINPEDGGESAEPTSADDSVVDGATSADSATPAPSEVEEPRVSDDDPNSDTYAQKWRTLQGMYNADMGRMQAQLRDSSARTSHLEQLIASLSNTPPAAPRPQGNQRPQSLDLVSDTDKTEYGESLDVMRKVSREELYPLLNKIAELESALGGAMNNINSVVPQVQRVAQQQAQSTEERFWAALADRVPDWQKINNDPNFQAWLLDVDPLTGHTRQAYLEQAQKQLDPNRVVSIFNMYGSGGGAANGAPASAQSARSASELERQVSPGRSRGAGIPTGQKTATYTPADLASFYNDVRNGKYKGKETERDRIERDIFAAQRDGRIVANS